MKHVVITISREYGSGGRLIGKALAAKLGFKFYDKEMIHLLMEESGFTKETIEEWQERRTSSFLYNLYMSTQEKPLSDQIYLAKTRVVSELAEKESCVIVGNCADYILRDRENVFSAFIYAPMEERMKRVQEVYHENKEGNPKYIKNMDKKRNDYYNYFTMHRWGDCHNYDICVDSSLGIEITADMLYDVITEIYGGTKNGGANNARRK